MSSTPSLPATTEAVASSPTTGRQGLLEIWRRGLLHGDYTDPHAAVIAELSEFYKLSPEEARHRCINWKDYSVQEWLAGDRSTPEGLLDFYRTQTSWVFDTLWYHANQYIGQAPAETVEITLGLPPLPPGRMLDFGAGPGSSAIFFRLLGWEVALADVSTTMQEFAKWRLARRGMPATFYDPSRDSLPTAAFDLITAFDVMVHVPNVVETLADLHRALKPGGYFVFNIDNQPNTLEHHGHLYETQWPILRHVRRTGFRRLPKISYFHVYQKVERGPLAQRVIAAFDDLRYNQAVTAIGDLARSTKRRVNGLRQHQLA